ncbi:hypothetical protein CcaverHIS002_0305930 [Cutaneotrichosporon cavernicola]|uniref:Uricase n=1 Tax=Cutaneotrichosporon cavernicola TaxID=279322 RepID=A0AA48L2T8_9TREE|nr:uncharacterized protein CcaverHIS019_0305880 [Cutaneotrichosporon cavernicola]BEI82725.1 hypothetical protein CcaverHIS002_0305930 [Cutaneotrichosporon cavernicola]BEI90518.1 hypothetical protein CcaverHIS019_0305880 [Cutaneotrichosporon cavernicola]BEI98292.1 hypothetical protein CcaverHIS631_0305910 [Cutaneotrichosporon cavernicola]BEJ06067.1 hypothetical protein CcaverHIS641_0305890 [Cutaneotrichosporon cavernicola]
MSPSNEPGYVSAHRYGKRLVRVARVVRENIYGQERHSFIEYTVRALIDGDIESSYTKADNKCVVPTDTVKNTVNVLAKTSPHVLDPGMFALHIATHFATRYDHINKAYVDLTTHKWTRIPVEGKPHKWSFVRDGEEKQQVSCFVDAADKKNLKANLQCGLRDLSVAKTSGSSFEDFWTDEYTTLVAVKDRIFSTDVDCWYTVPLPKIPLTIDNIGAIGKALNLPKVAEIVRRDTLEVFATDESASVQATMYNTQQLILKHCPVIESISYSLPNKHFIPINLTAFGLENGLGYEGGAEVFHPVADPSGFIEATVTRKSKAKL